MSAGSKPGERRGGRKAGTPNKVPGIKTIGQEAAEAGEQPLAYMLRIMRDRTQDDDRRDRMAIAAAAFLHPKLASTEAKVKVNLSHEESLDVLDQVASTTQALNGHAKQ